MAWRQCVFRCRIDDAKVTPERLQTYRGVEVLERIGSKAKAAALQKLADGEPAALRTQEAKRALERMK